MGKRRSANAKGKDRPQVRKSGAAWRIDAAAALRAIHGALSSRAEAGTFAAFLKRIRHRTSEGEPLALHDDPDSRRFLGRLGVVASPGARARSRTAEEVSRFLEEAARGGGPEPAVASVLVRAFASGVYGVVGEPVCGDAPRCDECPLAGVCRERNSPGGRAREFGQGESPSERLVSEGPEALLTEELMAILAAGGSRAKEGEAACACESLLGDSGGLRGLAGVPATELAKSKGITARGSRAIASAMALARRWAAEPRPLGRAFRTGADFFNHYRLKLRDLKKEVFMVVLLDQKNRAITDEVCSEGTLTSSLVHPREVFRRAVQESAAAVAFVHNHPSGDPAPSAHDREITERLVEAAKLIGIRLLDHVVIGDTRFYSFFEEGML